MPCFSRRHRSLVLWRGFVRSPVEPASRVTLVRTPRGTGSRIGRADTAGSRDSRWRRRSIAM
eukprot:scaffold126854_cov46-Prasinocladus_malaysianus.AAC.1